MKFSKIKHWLVNRCLQKTLFIDLDGTLIRTKSGVVFAKDKDDWTYVEHILEAIDKYNPYNIFIVTNQGGIEKGFVNRDDFYSKLHTIVEKLKEVTLAKNVSYIVCEECDPNNYYRKPNNGAFYKFLDDYQFSTHESLIAMVGDASGYEGQFSASDREFAEKSEIPYYDVNEFIAKFGNTSCKECLMYNQCNSKDRVCSYYKQAILKEVKSKRKNNGKSNIRN